MVKYYSDMKLNGGSDVKLFKDLGNFDLNNDYIFIVSVKKENTFKKNGPWLYADIEDIESQELI